MAANEPKNIVSNAAVGMDVATKPGTLALMGKNGCSAASVSMTLADANTFSLIAEIN